VEKLRNGDLVTTPKKDVPIKMYSYTLTATPKTAPYRIKANTFGKHNQICLSGGHAFKDNKGLWQFPMFCKNPNIQQYDIGKTVTYYHIECPNYFTDNLIAEGLVVESFRNGKSAHKQEYTWNNSLTGFIRKQEPPNLLPALGTDCIEIDVISMPRDPDVIHVQKGIRVVPIPTKSKQ
jgi:hypothetical protein